MIALETVSPFAASSAIQGATGRGEQAPPRRAPGTSGQPGWSSEQARGQGKAADEDAPVGEASTARHSQDSGRMPPVNRPPPPNQASGPRPGGEGAADGSSGANETEDAGASNRIRDLLTALQDQVQQDRIAAQAAMAEEEVPAMARPNLSDLIDELSQIDATGTAPSALVLAN